jgi:hypothetical protein
MTKLARTLSDCLALRCATLGWIFVCQNSRHLTYDLQTAIERRKKSVCDDLTALCFKPLDAASRNSAHEGKSEMAGQGTTTQDCR